MSARDYANPSAIDDYVAIADIHVNGRHRHDLGNLAALGRSILDVGLLNPITLTRDRRLVAGQRRMEACRSIGMDTVPVRYVDTLDDAAALLRAERDENVCREDMKPSELAALGEALLAIEAERAKVRQGTRTDLQHPGNASGMLAGLTGDSRDAVGEALGMSGRTYSELRGAYTLANDPAAPPEHRQAAQEALAKMDAGEGIWPARDELRQKLRNNLPTPEPQAEPGARPEPDHDDLWVPNIRAGKSPEARGQRIKLIRHYGTKGETSRQIGERLGMRPATVRRIARDEGISLTGDQVFGRSRQRIDSNRIIRETVSDLENLEMALNLVDFGDLNKAEIENWTASLSKSIRTLNRLIKQLKEKAQ